MQQRPRDDTAIPSTARDFNALSPLLSLPASFGSISLGETFSSCICLMNQTNYEIEGVQIKVEMQSATAKSTLLELGGPEHRLGPLGTLEGIVSSEIKELGQHTLSCIVHYRVPQGLRPPAPSDDPSDPRAQLFRKHYRFPVNNPFSVKSKVHLPKSPTALMSRSEREKVFLEIHVQNLTQEPMWFEKLEFRPVDGWNNMESNVSDQSPRITSETKGRSPNSLIHPQDTIQYVYTLMPATIPNFLIKPTPGSVIPLGRLDMVWRSTFGEPGRLLTSVRISYALDYSITLSY
jgi:trafficking protein particle complex subunit 13